MYQRIHITINASYFLNGSPFFLQNEELTSAGSAGSSSQGSTEPWDNPFNRATNAYKKRDKDLPPTSAGHTSGFGLGMKHAEYYNEDPKARKERRIQKAAADNRVIESLKEQVV